MRGRRSGRLARSAARGSLAGAAEAPGGNQGQVSRTPLDRLKPSGVQNEPVLRYQAW